jgi:hypothetical protein
LQVELAGFKKYERTNIHLEPNGHLSLGEIRLSLGGLNEEIMVAAEGTALQTVSSERSGVVTSERSDVLSHFLGLKDRYPGTCGKEKSLRVASAAHQMARRRLYADYAAQLHPKLVESHRNPLWSIPRATKSR